MLWHKEKVKTVFNHLATGEGGLTPEEAEKRLDTYGENILTEGKKEGILKNF